MTDDNTVGAFGCPFSLTNLFNSVSNSKQNPRSSSTGSRRSTSRSWRRCRTAGRRRRRLRPRCTRRRRWVWVGSPGARARVGRPALGRHGRARLGRWTSTRLSLGQAPMGLRRRRRSIKRRKSSPCLHCAAILDSVRVSVSVSVSGSLHTNRSARLSHHAAARCRTCREMTTFFVPVILVRRFRLSNACGNNSRREVVARSKDRASQGVPTTNLVSFVLATCLRVPWHLKSPHLCCTGSQDDDQWPLYCVPMEY